METEQVTKLEYIKLLEQEGLTEKDLPTHLKSKVTALKMVIGKYNKNQTEELKQRIINQDAKLTAEIDAELEEEGPEPAPVVAPVAKVEPVIVAPVAKVEPVIVAPVAKTQADIDAENKLAEDAKKVQAKSDSDAKVQAMVDQIKEKVNAHPEKRISTADLAQIIGKSPSHPETVGSIVMRRIYPIQFYKIG